MKICIDGLGAACLKGTGIYTHTFEMVNNLLKIYPQSQYKIIWDQRPLISKWEKYKNIEFVDFNINRRENDYTSLNEYILNHNITLYHSPNNGFSMINKRKCKNIMTVHDLIPISHREYGDEKYIQNFMNVFPKAIENSDIIIAVSHFIKEELMDYLQVSEEKIKVIYPGCSEIFKPIEEGVWKGFLKKKYNIKGDFLLYAGSIHKRKNLNILLEVFHEVKKYIKSLKLVIVGKNDEKREEYYWQMRALSRYLGIDDDVIYTGIVDYLDMPYFYNGAKCIVNLSDYEGFPLTTIEGMACSKAVICSNTSSFKEILGDGIIMIDPKDKVLIKDMLLEVIRDDNYRRELGERGKEYAKKFQWEETIKKLVKIYESIA